MEWWSEQPAIIRYGVSLAFIAGSSYLFFVERVLTFRFWALGTAIGVGLLCMSGPSDSEKKGYHF